MRPERLWITTAIAVAEKAGKVGKAPARSTIHDEIVTLRLVLKTGIRHGWLPHLPDFSPPYKTSGKIVQRPWFSPAEYKQLYTATRAYAKDPPQPQYQWNADQLSRCGAGRNRALAGYPWCFMIHRRIL